MAKSAKNTAVARQVELIVRRLGSVSILPQVAVAILSGLNEVKANSAQLAAIIESDPALSAKILSLANKHRIQFTDGKPSVSEAVNKLPRSVIRDAVLSVTVFNAYKADYDPDSERILPRKQLALHALAVGCCAKSIVGIAGIAEDPQLAFMAGLFHDIGKLAIDEAMPKSFDRMVEHAKARNTSLCEIEQACLGLDHTIIGKRLAEKWELPREIVSAVWLHHSDAELIVRDMPEARLGLVVALADIIARQCQIGSSGSFDAPGSEMGLARTLSISPEQIEQIRAQLADEVARRAEILGLDTSGAQVMYSGLIQQTAAALSGENTELTEVNQQLSAEQAQNKFISWFLLAVGPKMSPSEVAEIFVEGFQKHYQTGAICLYLKPDKDEPFLEVVTVGRQGRVNNAVLTVPTDYPAIPEKIQKSFAIVDTEESCEWIFDQIDLQIDPSIAKMIPLLSGSKSIGAIIFEQRLPRDISELKDLLYVSTSIAAGVIELIFAKTTQSELAERMTQVLSRLRRTREELAAAKSLIAVAEMAAGAAHELNNPLAVISGRAQLLHGAETDKDKKQMLKQIQQRTEEISQIVNDLMSFARPTMPEPYKVSVKELLDKAVGQTAKAHKIKKMEIEFVSIDQLGPVQVDPTQIVTAISNILSNALESYNGGGGGPVTVTAMCIQKEAMATFQIIDKGCGMDTQTLDKATQPFFSNIPAGRKRGMGLAHAERLIRLNKGALSIHSQLRYGTTVTISLPLA